MTRAGKTRAILSYRPRWLRRPPSISWPGMDVAAGRVAQLGLPLMSRHNGTRHQTAFTVSIEAKEGVTSGISAPDRARTIHVAIDPSHGRDDIVTPGHIF